jgi:RNA polymerase sigma factor (TIGR02999 family)
MSDVTRILSRIEEGDGKAADQLLPLVYDELRKLAAQKMALERPGQTLQATALVHEAYIRLVDVDKAQHWDSLGHFFAAAAEAMRRILVENARRKAAGKHGGLAQRVDLSEEAATTEYRPSDVLSLDQALSELEGHDALAARLITMRFFAGLTHKQAAESLGITRREADRLWRVGRVWLYRQLNRS